MAVTGTFAAAPMMSGTDTGGGYRAEAKANYPALKPINYKITGDQRKDIVGFAKTQLDYKEKSGNKTYFGAWYGMNGQPWCAMFICWAAAKSHVPTTVIPKLATADRGWAKKKKVYYKSAQWGGTYVPKAGDLIYFSWSVRDYADHIGLVSGTGKVKGVTYVYTIEGNKHDKVKAGSYALDNRYILGYTSPKYGGTVPTTTKPTTTKPTTKPTTVGSTYRLLYRDRLKETTNDDSIIKPMTGTFGRDLTISSSKFKRTGYDYSKWYIYRAINGKAYYLCRDNATGTKETWRLFNGTPSGYSRITVGVGGKINIRGRVSSPIYLAPVWNAAKYTITYNSNGGLNAPAKQTKTYGQALTLSTAAPTRTGYTFLGWSENAKATSPQYKPGASFTINRSATLFAIWKNNTYQVKAKVDMVVRKGPGKTYAVVRKLGKGQAVTVVAEQNGWGKLSDGSWIMLSLTERVTPATTTTKPTTTKPAPAQTTAKPTVSSAAGVYRVTGDVYKRKGPGQNYADVGVLKKDTRVTVISNQGKWAKLSDGTWASMNYLVKVTATTSAPASGSKSASAAAGDFTVKVTANSLYMRSGPGKSNKQKGTVKKNDVLKISQVSNGWGKIRSNGNWISLKYTTIVSGYKIKITAKDLSLRNGPGKKYKKVGTAKPGTYTISRISGKWGKLKTNGKWVHLSYTTRVK